MLRKRDICYAGSLDLHLSISHSMPSCVKLLTERVPDAVNDAVPLPNDRKHDGCTPLIYALLYSQGQGVDPLIHMLNMLLDAHADPNKGQCRAAGGQTALHMAIMNNDPAAVDLLLHARTVGLTRTRAPTATPEDDRGEKA